MGRVDFTASVKEERTFAGMKIPVLVTPHFKHQGYVARMASSIKSLLDGMRLTFSYLVHPSKVVTRQYPENRATLKLPERFRASLRMIKGENGWHNCTACKICERACPNASISVTVRRNPRTNDRELDRYVWRQDSCVYCNACVEACPFDALEMTSEFENAVYDRRLLVYTLNRYAGPAANAIKKVEDPEARAKLVATMTPRDRYGGLVPMNGHALPYLRALNVTPVADVQPEGAKAEGADA